MSDWVPASKKFVLSLIEQGKQDLSQKDIKFFNKYSVPLEKYKILRNDKVEEVFVVAKKDNQILYYEDVEEGFEITTNFSDKTILEYGGTNQDTLSVAIYKWGKGMFQ